MTFESGAGYSKLIDGGQDLIQATDTDLADTERALGQATATIRDSWLRHYSADVERSPAAVPATAPAAVIGEEMENLGICLKACQTTGSISFTHPTWGPSTLYTTLHSGTNVGPGEAHIVVFDANQEIVWQYDTEEFMELAPATPSTDETGHLFLNFNPGRLNGVIVLASVADGFDNFDSLPFSGEYRTRFYGSQVLDVEGDGVNEIQIEINDCDSSCATGATTTQLYRWTGQGYESD